MTLRSLLICGLVLSAVVPGMAQAASKPAAKTFGTWRNPQNSVHIRAQPCGKMMCGVVVWANDKAKADAAKGGTDKLIGSALFQGFEQESEGVWRGKVFVPDIGKTFSGTISVIDANHMEGKGCLLGKVGCKSQIWTRMK